MLIWYCGFVHIWLVASNMSALTIPRPIYLMLRLVSRKEVISVRFYSIYLLTTYLVLKYSNCLLFADGLKHFRKISDPFDCQLLQYDLTSISNWCFNNLLNLKSVIPFLLLDLIPKFNLNMKLTPSDLKPYLVWKI